MQVVVSMLLPWALDYDQQNILGEHSPSVVGYLTAFMHFGVWAQSRKRKLGYLSFYYTIVPLIILMI